MDSRKIFNYKSEILVDKTIQELGYHPDKWVCNMDKKSFCQNKEILECMDKIKNNLTFDLVKPEYRGKTPIHGSCYLATEALYHLLKDKYDIKIKRYKLDNGVVHWWAELENEIIDITKEQFDFVVPYSFGKGGPFLTTKPSKRCVTLLDKMKSN